jgi:hypothetical protein
MNTKTKNILSEYIQEKLVDEELDYNELIDSYEEMEWQVWEIFNDLANEDWEGADTKLIRVKNVYG